jgi:hypothetical protein
VAKGPPQDRPSVDPDPGGSLAGTPKKGGRRKVKTPPEQPTSEQDRVGLLQDEARRRASLRIFDRSVLSAVLQMPLVRRPMEAVVTGKVHILLGDNPATGGVDLLAVFSSDMAADSYLRERGAERNEDRSWGLRGWRLYTRRKSVFGERR